MTSRILEALRSIAGDTNVLSDLEDRTCYSYDATGREYLPDAVVHAETSTQVAEIVRLANRENIPVIPRGAGSGFSGGSLPVQGGIVLVLARMNRILAIDEDNLVAVVQPGVITRQLQEAVEKLGLFYPPDPASLDFSTIGGNVAECAGGPRCLKYGVTKDYVLGMEVVTPTGEIIHTGGTTMKNVVGYDLSKLFTGSEGTLGIITEINLKLLPKPEAKKTMLAQFTSIDGAAKAVSAIIRGKIIPATLEFLDATTLDCLRKESTLDIPAECRAVLIIEVDGDRDVLDRQAARIAKIIQPLGVITTRIAETAEESDDIWNIRRSVSPSLRNIAPDKFNEDIVVPRSKVPDMIRGLEEISARYGVPIVNFGHAGDGNIHVNVMVDLRIPGMQQKVDKALDDIFRITLDLGGSISGEHGIGTTKAPYLSMELDEATRNCMQTIKKALDPNNIMNPGKIFQVS